MNRNTIVTITDRTYLTVVYLLLLSLKYNDVNARIKVLCVGLNDEEKKLLTQIQGVECYDGDPSNTRNPATRKAEAILLAEHDETEYVTLLDGDGLSIGNVTPFLSPGEGFSSRIKGPQEETNNFRQHFDEDEPLGTVPRKIMSIWQKDVGEREKSRIKNTQTSGNLTVHRSCFPFVKKWDHQMKKVLPLHNPGQPYHFDNLAYHQMDESVLNSLLAFAHEAPKIIPGNLDVSSEIYIAHLGPGKPRPWTLLRKEKLQYLNLIHTLIAWGNSQGLNSPDIPWTFNKRYKFMVICAAYLHSIFVKLKNTLKAR